jgi:flagellar M-ring protein FliF
MADRTALTDHWAERSAGEQWAIVGAAVVLLALLLAAAYWAFRPNYQPLFSDLRPQDAATITAELDRQKISYRLADGGATILVPEKDVHAARMKVMSRDLPLKGTVGFELFNNADLGLTEFAQKVNYQRALQGELARTIMSLHEVDSARVHLSLPESGLFRRNGAKPRASVALGTRSGAELPPDAVRGIQRLVAAAVPELEAHEVTIINPQGAPMASGAGDTTVVTDRKLEVKIELEQYYARKVMRQVESIVGSGNASVSVDASLNFDQIRITQETLGGVPRRRVESRPKTLELPVSDALAADSSRERLPPPTADASARRIEQIIAAPGNVQRLTIAVLIAVPLDPLTTDQLRNLIAAAAGLSSERGDSISFFAREGFSPTSARPAAAPPMTSSAPPGALLPVEERETKATTIAWSLGAILLILLTLTAVLALAGRSTRRTELSDAERAEQLERLRRALKEERSANG